MAKQGSLLPNFIESPSPRGLRRLMFQAMVKNKAELDFYVIGSYIDKRGKTKHYAWYKTYIDVKDIEELGSND